MFHICNDCEHELDCKYSQQKFKNGHGQFWDNSLYRKEQEQRFTNEMINFVKGLKNVDK